VEEVRGAESATQTDGAVVMERAKMLIEALVKGRYDARLRGIRKTCALRFGDDHRVVVEVNDGYFGIARDDAVEDCELSCSLDDFVRIFRGDQNLITSIMRGAVGVRGDLSVAQMFQSVFSPGTSEVRSRRAERTSEGTWSGK
jgi:putative sterol carrier protein